MIWFGNEGGVTSGLLRLVKGWFMVSSGSPLRFLWGGFRVGLILI